MLDRIREIFDIGNNIPNPPYDYDFLINLNEKEYPKYLKKIFKEMTGESLNLNHPKTFNEKIQWLKLYDTTPLKTQLTDKVLVRDWIKDKIGEQYLKPCLQICNSFEEVDFNSLPESFIIKTNNGCKWHYKIKVKQKLIEDKLLYNFVKTKMEGWLSQTFFPFAGFEMQYKYINPKIIIEPLLIENETDGIREFEIYCFNGVPKIFQEIKYTKPRQVSVYDENFYPIKDLKFVKTYVNIPKEADNLLKTAVNLSEILASDFKLVRVDWMVYKNTLYFNELTFTPFSGFYEFSNKKWNYKLGKMLNLK